jgi:hypothetical protein
LPLISLRAILRFRHLEESEVQVWNWRWSVLCRCRRLTIRVNVEICANGRKIAVSENGMGITRDPTCQLT